MPNKKRNAKLSDILEKVNQDDGLREMMNNDPEKFFRKAGINVDNLPPEMLSAISGAGVVADTWDTIKQFGDLIVPIADAFYEQIFEKRGT